MNEEYDKLVRMKLHEVIQIDNFVTVMRVYGGWIYTRKDVNTMTSVFVPK